MDNSKHRKRRTTGEIRASLSGRKILFVDDSADMRDVFLRSFRKTGAIIHLADGPHQAIAMAQTTTYSVVVTDLEMPEMTGLEMIDVLWKEDPTIGLVLVTGIVELNLPTESPSARAICSMVRKPWLPEQLQSAMVQAADLNDRRSESRSHEDNEICVLIVEDDPLDARLMDGLLRSKPGNPQFVTTQVSRLGTGMKRLGGGDFDIILADMSLPDARGLDTVAGLKRAAPGLPIVVLSGSDDEELAIQAVKAGAQDYLVKDELTQQGLQRAIRYAIERKNTEEHLAYLAHHDQLTGLANRALFSRRATTIIAQALVRGSKPAVLMLDLDRFKNTNDTLGHSVGDLLLIQVADRLRSCVDDEDYLARLGGDEFAVIIEQIGDQPGAGELAKRILSVIEGEFLVGDHTISIGVTIGISVFPENGSDIEQLLSKADAAMYRGKEAGRSRYQFFDQQMHLQAVQWMELERCLRGALERDEFELHYQPQVDCVTNKVVCFEALLRWTSEELGAVGPFRFVPVLEDIGIIDKVGAWVTQEACRQIAKWRRFSPELRMAVNVSAVQFEDDNLVEIIMGALADTGLPAGALEIEITEGLLMKDLEKTMATLDRLSDLGVRIAIDDFGTGYSNLSYLARFPIDLLKIDKSITEMTGSHDGDSIARAVVQLGHALNIEILAEGVETRKELEFLRETKVECYQGYFFAKPMKVIDVESMLGFPVEEGVLDGEMEAKPVTQERRVVSAIQQVQPSRRLA